MPRGTKVDTAEKAIKKSAARKGFAGKKADAYVFGTLNNVGLKRGSKTTARGAMPSKTARAVRSSSAKTKKVKRTKKS